MNLVVQELFILLLVISLAIFSAFKSKHWYIDATTINIKVKKISNVPHDK